jgi:hypothetical protein
VFGWLVVLARWLVLCAVGLPVNSQVQRARSFAVRGSKARNCTKEVVGKKPKNQESRNQYSNGTIYSLNSN